MPGLLFGTVVTMLCVALLGLQAVAKKQKKRKFLAHLPRLATGIYVFSWCLLGASLFWSGQMLGWGQGIAFWLCSLGVVGLSTLYLRESLSVLYQWAYLSASIVGVCIFVANVHFIWVGGGG